MHVFTPEGLRTVRATFPGCIGGVRTADDADICRFSKNLQNGTGFVTNPCRSSGSRSDVEVLSGWRKISRNIEYEDLRHGETREEYLKPVYTKYGAHRVGNKNPSQIAKNNLDINTLTTGQGSSSNLWKIPDGHLEIIVISLKTGWKKWIIWDLVKI